MNDHDRRCCPHLHERVAELEAERDAARQQLVETQRRWERLTAAVRAYLDLHDRPHSHTSTAEIDDTILSLNAARREMRKLLEADDAANP